VSVRWDGWNVVQDTISDKQKAGPPLVAVLWAQAWNPPSLHAAESLETIRSNGQVGGVQVFIVDKDKELQKAMEFEIVACPSLVMYWKGEIVTVRRTFRADAVKYTGSVTKETWQAILEEGLKAGARYDEGETFLRATYEH